MSKNSKWNLEEVLAVLTAKYPKAFFPKDSPDTKPLRIGIFTLITGQKPEFGRAIIGAALKRYTSKDRYMRALATCQDRVDLDGNPFEPVSEKNRLRAITTLAERQAAKLQKAA